MIAMNAEWSSFEGHLIRQWPLALERVFVAAFVLALVGCNTLPRPETRAVAELQGADLDQADKLLRRADHFPHAEEAAAVYRLRAAEVAWAVLSAGSGAVRDVAALPEQQRHALRVLDTSAEKLTPLFVGSHAPAERQFSYAGFSYRVKASQLVTRGMYPPAAFASVKPVREVPRKLVRHWHEQAGVGAPLSPQWKSPPNPRLKRFMGDWGYLAPITATLDFAAPARPGTVRTATITTMDPTTISRVRIGRAEYPLAADFTAPMVDRVIDIPEFRLGVKGLFNPESVHAQLSMLEPYDPRRIPVVLVHGLNSHPRMWRNVVNDLRADPALRGRYQFWMFYYPTGWPIPYSSLRLREELAALDHVIGPQHHMTFIGHSMGGLLSRLQVISPGRMMWDAEIGGDADRLFRQIPDRHVVKRALLFRRNPEIDRVVFICVPQRGSSMADLSLVRWITKLIRLPRDIAVTIADIPAAVFAGRPLNSIANLSPQDPLFKPLERVPMPVSYHSIIGDRGRGDTPHSSDGVVPYASSHLDGAQSELIVPAGHGAYDDPKAIEEMKRILKLHLPPKG